MILYLITIQKCKLSNEEENIIKIMWDINKRITPSQLIDEVEKRYYV